jgi:hypothetical protein
MKVLKTGIHDKQGMSSEKLQILPGMSRTVVYFAWNQDKAVEFVIFNYYRDTEN